MIQGVGIETLVTDYLSCDRLGTTCSIQTGYMHTKMPGAEATSLPRIGEHDVSPRIIKCGIVEFMLCVRLGLHEEEGIEDAAD